MGLAETAQPLWASAASYEERIAALLDAYGESLEAAVHRMSAASCYQKAGDPSRATNLYRAALAGPLRAVTRTEVEEMLSECLALLKAAAPPSLRFAHHRSRYLKSLGELIIQVRWQPPEFEQA
jgi:hypothetical protein